MYSTLRSYRFIASDRIKQTYTNENKEDVVSRKCFETSDSTKRPSFFLTSMGKKERKRATSCRLRGERNASKTGRSVARRSLTGRNGIRQKGIRKKGKDRNCGVGSDVTETRPFDLTNSNLYNTVQHAAYQHDCAL